MSNDYGLRKGQRLTWRGINMKIAAVHLVEVRCVSESGNNYWLSHRAAADLIADSKQAVQA